MVFGKLVDRGLRCALAAIVLVAAVASVRAAPAHAGGLNMARAGSEAPCPGHSVTASAEPALGAAPEVATTCTSFCGLAAPDHFVGQACMSFSLAAAAKLVLPTVPTVTFGRPIVLGGTAQRGPAPPLRRAAHRASYLIAGHFLV